MSCHHHTFGCGQRPRYDYSFLFNREPYASEFDKLGRVPVLKARMNADLHMADDPKNTGTGNLFVIFGEPDVDVIEEGYEADTEGCLLLV